MNETLRLFLDLVVRNANGGKQVADDVRRLRMEAAGSARPFNTYERDLERIGKRAGLTAQDVAKLRREIEATNRVVLTDKRGGILPAATAGASTGASAAGAAGLAGTLARGVGFGAAAFGGPLVVREAFEITRAMTETQAQMEGLSSTLDVLADRYGIIRTEFDGTEAKLKALGITTVQSREAIRDFTRAGASQGEVITLVGLAMDSAARQGLSLDDAISRLTRATLKAEPELLDELGIVIKLDQVYRNYAKTLGISNANTLTTEQRSRALVEALTKQAAAGGEFAAQSGTIAGKLLEIDQTGKIVQERLSNLFSGPVSSAAETYLGLLKSIDGALQSVEQRKTSEQFIREAQGVKNITDLRGFNAAQQASTTEKGRVLVDASRNQFNASVPALIDPTIKALQSDPGGLALAGQIQGERETAAKLAKELREKLDPVAQRIIEGLALEKLDGLDEIRGERDQTLGRLKGASPSLLSQIREGFAAREVRFLTEEADRIRKAESQQSRDFASSLRENRVQTQFVQLDDNAKRGQQQLIDRVRQVPKDIEEFNQGRIRTIEQIADAEAQIIQLRSRDGSEIRDVLALRLRTIEQIAAIEGETARVTQERLQAQLDAQTELARLDRDRLDRGRNAAESAFDALVSGGGGGVNAFLKSQITGVGRTVTGNLAETLLKNSGTLGLDGLIGGQQKNGKLTPIGQALQGTFLGLNPADIQRRNIEALDLNTTEIRQLTAAISGRAGGDGAALTPFRSEGGGSLGIDWLRENTQTSATAAESTNEATKETNQLLAKIVQTSIFGGAAATSIAGGSRRGGVGGALQVGGGIAGALSGLNAIAPFLGPAAPFVQAAGILAPLIGGFFGGPDPLKREKEIQDTLNRNKYNAPDSTSRSFDTFGRSVEVGGGSVRITNINVDVSTMDARSFMQNRAMIGEAARQAMFEDGGASLNDIRTYFEG